MVILIDGVKISVFFLKDCGLKHRFYISISKYIYVALEVLFEGGGGVWGGGGKMEMGSHPPPRKTARLKITFAFLRVGTWDLYHPKNLPSPPFFLGQNSRPAVFLPVTGR